MGNTEKINILFEQVKKEFISIHIPLEIAGKIEIAIAKRKCKRYGCCKQSKPDERTKRIRKYKQKIYTEYGVYQEHQIEISKWVLEMKEEIIKNTIAHELIHCLPYCNNHGENFKKYASYINQELGYSIERTGNKKEDYAKSNLPYIEQTFKYKIQCMNCKQTYQRNRLAKNFSKKYKCGICGGKLKIIK